MSKRTQAQGAAEGEGEADSPLSRESDVGLNPRSQRQMLNRLSYPGAPRVVSILNKQYTVAH